MLDAGNTAMKTTGFSRKGLHSGVRQTCKVTELYNTHYSKRRGTLTVLSLWLRKSYGAAVRVSKYKAYGSVGVFPCPLCLVWMIIHAAPTTVATAGEQTQGEGIWEAPSLGFCWENLCLAVGTHARLSFIHVSVSCRGTKSE